MILYAIKVNDQYLRVRPDHFEIVGMDKASVYPVEKRSFVEEKLAEAKKSGMSNARIIQMRIVESEDN